MRATLLIGLMSAAIAVACEKSPTGVPAATSSHAAPEHLLLIGRVYWKAIRLPFVPTAINDAGAIVGYQTGAAAAHQPVIWQNGTLSMLPVANVYDGDAVPTAISPNGVIAGVDWHGGLVWMSSAVEATRIFTVSTDGFNSSAAGVYDDGSVVGTLYDNGATFAFRRSPSGIGTFGPGSNITAADGSGNGYGHRSDGVLVRYGATAITPLPLLFGSTNTAYATGADARGDVVGFVQGASAPVMWKADGTISVLTGLPNTPAGVNDAGRLIGSELVGGIEEVWTSYQGSLAVLTADSQGAHAVAVNGCGSIIAQNVLGGYGWLFVRTLSTNSTTVCDGQTVLLRRAR